MATGVRSPALRRPFGSSPVSTHGSNCSTRCNYLRQRLHAVHSASRRDYKRVRSLSILPCAPDSGAAALVVPDGTRCDLPPAALRGAWSAHHRGESARKGRCPDLGPGRSSLAGQRESFARFGPRPAHRAEHHWRASNRRGSRVRHAGDSARTREYPIGRSADARATATACGVRPRLSLPKDASGKPAMACSKLR